MMSIFDIKAPLPFDANLFEQMKKAAFDALDNVYTGEYTQALVLFSSKGITYTSVIENALLDDKQDEKALLDRLTLANDTEIERILCVWQNRNIDIPSYSFRKMLCETDQKNTECGIFVMTPNGASVVKFGITIK